MVEKLNLSKYFKLVIGFDDIKRAKPDPEAVLKACDELEINSNEALVIGDSKNDVIMGNAVNAQTVLFHPDNYDLFYDIEDLKKSNPSSIIQNLKELKRILNHI